MKVLILTEGGKNIGFGHVTRTLSIAQAFQEKGIEPLMVVKGNESIKPLLKEVKHSLGNWMEDRSLLEELLKGAEIVIIDSYQASKELYEFAYKKAGLLVSIDDFNRIEYPGGIVVNGNIYAKELNYPKKENITYLLGTKYIPLRKPFWDVPNKEIKEEVKEVLITFGGDDSKNMTPKVLRMLAKGFPELIKRVVIGRGFRNIEEIKASADKNTELIFYPDAEKMKDLMLSADVAISAGGQTLYELARVGVPTIAVMVAENQRWNVEGWEKVGFIDIFLQWNERNVISDIYQELQKFISNYKQRLNSSMIGKKLIDGLGSRRLVSTIML